MLSIATLVAINHALNQINILDATTDDNYIDLEVVVEPQGGTKVISLPYPSNSSELLDRMTSSDMFLDDVYPYSDEHLLARYQLQQLLLKEITYSSL